MAVENATNPLVGVNRHRAFLHDHLVAADAAGNLRDHGFYIREVGGASVALGGADGDEDGLAVFDGPAQIGGELHAAAAVFGQQLGQSFFKDGHAACTEGSDPGFVIVHADDAVAHFGKANCRDESHVSGSDHTNRNWV